MHSRQQYDVTMVALSRLNAEPFDVDSYAPLATDYGTTRTFGWTRSSLQRSVNFERRRLQVDKNFDSLKKRTARKRDLPSNH